MPFIRPSIDRIYRGFFVHGLGAEGIVKMLPELPINPDHLETLWWDGDRVMLGIPVVAGMVTPGRVLSDLYLALRRPQPAMPFAVSERVRLAIPLPMDVLVLDHGLFGPWEKEFGRLVRIKFIGIKVDHDVRSKKPGIFHGVLDRASKLEVLPADTIKRRMHP